MKKFFIASIMVYVVYQILGFWIHQVILSGSYGSLENLWRSDQKTWIIGLTGVI